MHVIFTSCLESHARKNKQILNRNVVYTCVHLSTQGKKIS